MVSLRRLWRRVGWRRVAETSRPARPPQSLPSNPDWPGLALAATIVVASAIPAAKGAVREAFGPFTPRAELVNLRAAMLGVAAVLALEAMAGVPFF